MAGCDRDTHEDHDSTCQAADAGLLILLEKFLKIHNSTSPYEVVSHFRYTATYYPFIIEKTINFV